MTTNICIRTFDEPKINKKEILRYARVRETSPEVCAHLEECLEEARAVLSYKAVYRMFPMDNDRRTVSLGFTTSDAELLIHAFWCCTRVVVLAATVGTELDRLIRRYSVLSPAKAQMLDAIGAERIEALVDALSEELSAEAEGEGYEIKARVSPGYGDLPLSMQRDIFRTLDCSRKIGLTLGETLLMSPQKSVTALIGLMPKC